MKCMICGNDKLEYKDTIISDFVMARISDDFEEGHNKRTRLCFCPKCTFAFYEYRMNDEEQSRLYKNYRDDNYQKTREKYECWYTPKINGALNNDKIALAEMLQWIWRSQIRRGQPINIYIPSKRMRRLLMEWLYGSNCDL